MTGTYTADPPPAPRLDVTAVASEPPRTPPVRTATAVTSDYAFSLLAGVSDLLRGIGAEPLPYRRPLFRTKSPKAKRKPYKGSKAARKRARRCK
jgi:hypothetical protein